MKGLITFVFSTFFYVLFCFVFFLCDQIDQSVNLRLFTTDRVKHHLMTETVMLILSLVETDLNLCVLYLTYWCIIFLKALVFSLICVVKNRHVMTNY